MNLSTLIFTELSWQCAFLVSGSFFQVFKNSTYTKSGTLGRPDFCRTPQTLCPRSFHHWPPHCRTDLAGFLHPCSNLSYLVVFWRHLLVQSSIHRQDTFWSGTWGIHLYCLDLGKKYFGILYVLYYDLKLSFNCVYISTIL